MKEYEITYLEKPGSESGTTGLIEGEGGKVLKTSPIGERALVYPIKKQSTASFKSIIFQMSPEKLSDLEGKLHLEEGVLRFIIAKPIIGGKMDLGLGEERKTAPLAVVKPPFAKASEGSAKGGKKTEKPAKVSKKAIEKELKKILKEDNA